MFFLVLPAWGALKFNGEGTISSPEMTPQHTRQPPWCSLPFRSRLLSLQKRREWGAMSSSSRPFQNRTDPVARLLALASNGLSIKLSPILPSPFIKVPQTIHFEFKIITHLDMSALPFFLSSSNKSQKWLRNEHVFSMYWVIYYPCLHQKPETSF